MMSKAEAAKNMEEDSCNRQLLNDIEAINRTLYVNKNHSRSLTTVPDVRPKSRPNNKHGTEISFQREKQSLWKSTLRALSHVRNRKFNCCFCLHVHSIEGLTSGFNDLKLCVNWKRRDEDLATRPVKVLNGIARFDEKLTYTCSVYGSRSGPHHSAKYEAKHFLLYTSIVGSPNLDMGKHRIDLTRLLPLTLEELGEEKGSGEWTTSFKLSGEAKGATLNVSFGYLVILDKPAPSKGIRNIPGMLNSKHCNHSGMVRALSTRPVQSFVRGTAHHADRSPNTNQSSHATLHSVEEIKELHEVSRVPQSDLASSVHLLYQKLDEDKMNPSLCSMPVHDAFAKSPEHLKSVSSAAVEADNSGNACETSEHSVVTDENELSTERNIKSKEVMKENNDALVLGSHEAIERGICVPTKLGYVDEESKIHRDDHEVQDPDFEDRARYSKELLMEELESALKNVANLEAEGFDVPEDTEYDAETKRASESDHDVQSSILDDVTESVASEFLEMLGIEHSPSGLSSESEAESPRERLLREFEKEAFASGSSLFDFATDDLQPSDYGDSNSEVHWEPSFRLPDDYDLSAIIHAAEEEYQMESQEAVAGPRAKVLEDLETEALMREWGLNESAFQHSPPGSSNNLGSMDLALDEALELPPLGEGVGPFLQTRNGGFLRSMSPSLFKNAKAGGDLVMQVSKPVVVPAEMGTGILDVLQKLAAVGIEKLSMQSNKLMPLDDITGKTMQQVAWEAGHALEGPQRECLMHHESDVPGDTSALRDQSKARSHGSKSNKSNATHRTGAGSEYVSLEDLAPLAMDKIEALSLEGLRIQSDMSDEDAPSNITAKSVGELSTLQGSTGGCLGLDGAAGLQLLDIKDNGEDVDGLMGLSLTLDEWLRYDSGEIGDEDEISEHTSRILAAHHAGSLDLVRGGTKGEKRKAKGGRRCGLLGNNFTVALMVQLRDPLRNYEPVGAPMLGLIQVERVFVPPKPRIHRIVAEVPKTTEEEDEEPELKDKVNNNEKIEEEKLPQYIITEVHLAGLKPGPEKKSFWGGGDQQRSGSRWLLANGMGKSNKHAVLKSKFPVPKPAAGPSTTPKVQPGDTFWSVSARAHGTGGGKWKELTKPNLHRRNPDVIFPKEKMRLR